MKLIDENITKLCAENEIIESIELDNKEILELGCGSAFFTRIIAQSGENRNITAAEIDDVQYNKNMLINDLPNVKFISCGAQEIPSENNSFDVVFMFKSLHHVPQELMAAALEEIHRILKPNGLLYLSEPLFHGEYNEVLRLFHDEQEVRQKAFETIKASVDNNQYSLRDEIFFNDGVVFNSFEEFENKLIKATYQNHQLDKKLYDKVQSKFNTHIKDGVARFVKPMRVDILRKN